MAVVGVGLIGGSMALACRGRLAGRVVALDTDQGHLDRAMALGLVDEVGELPGGVMGADLVVVAVPVGEIAEVVRTVEPHLSSGCVVTDVGSVKGELVAEVESVMPAGRAYVPGHPIAGTERSGPEAASATLFRGNLCVLTPTSRTSEAAVKAVIRLWEGMGSRVILMDPFRHDQIFALVSHLPHVVAYALIGSIPNREESGEDVLRFSAGGLRDFTRIAASHPVMWRDILIRNRGAVLESLARFRTVLERIEGMIRAQDAARLTEEFERARQMRERLR
jgi:prephenate dehydrogenase